MQFRATIESIIEEKPQIFLSKSIDLLRKENIDLIIDVRTAFDLDFSVISYNLMCERMHKIPTLLTALANLKAKALLHCLEGVGQTTFIVKLYIA